MSTPRVSANRKSRRGQKSRLWRFSTGRKPQGAGLDVEDSLVSFTKTHTESVLCFDSDDGHSAATVEKSGKSFPGSQLAPSLRGNSFTAAKKKQTRAFENEGYPPSGYLWIWMGVLRRWQRNHFLLETPGVLTHSRRRGSQMRGAFCLRDARVVPSRGNSRQFCIVSPAGVAYLRAVRRDQRGPWIASLRESIDQYTQCVEQAERASPSVGAMGYGIPAEDAQIEKEAKARLTERMSELVPHQAALKWQMNQLTRKLNSVKEILGSGESTDGEVALRRRPSVVTDGSVSRRLTGQGVRGGLESLHENRMVRHSSLTSELSVSTPDKSPVKAQRSARSPLAVNKTSTDDSDVNRRSVDVRGMRDRARLRKCQTPRPTPTRVWSSAKPSPRSNRAASRDVVVESRYEPTTPRRPSTESPFQIKAPDSTTLSDSGIWRSYQNFIDAVQRVLEKEVQATMELEVENAALRRLLGIRRGEEPVSPDRMLHVGGGSTSRSYSTAESEFDATLLENSEDEPTDAVTVPRKRTPLEAPANPELIHALEVVRRAEYVTRNSAHSEALVIDLNSGAPPQEFDDEYDEESNLDADVPLENLKSRFDEGSVQDSCELLGMVEPRLRLPAPRPVQRGFSLWSILKNAIGRDLSRITMPATINEPLSALQRFVEEFEHTSFLDRAAVCSHPHQRLLYVTAFVLSSYYSAVLRDSKPFNPLLGETFEWSNDRVRFLGEQVSHHPPVSCFHVQGFDPSRDEQLYHVQGELELKSKFWGTTLNVFPTGRMELYLETTQERFVWNKASISIHNLVLGQLWLDFHGDIQIKNATTGDYAKIRLARARGYAVDRGNLDGKIFTAQQREVYTIDGNYTKVIYAQKYPQSHREEIFRAPEHPPNAQEQYNMTSFAMGLNDGRGYEAGELPRTDSRFRPDVRCLEMGEFSDATQQKLRLEEKQRQTRKARKENGQKYVPMWFTLRRSDTKDITKQTADAEQPSVWKFREEYWKRKALRNWGGCPDIF